MWVAAPVQRHRATKRAGSERAKDVAVGGKALDAIVYALASQDSAELAGTSQGLYRSGDDGLTWEPVAALAMPDVRFLGVNGKIVFAATLKRLELSNDGGKSWDAVALPSDLTQIGAVTVDSHNNLWVGGREGVYYSTDFGETWHRLKDLFLTQVNSLYFDAPRQRVLVTSANSKFVFAVSVPEYKVSYWDTGWNLRFARPVGDHLVGATLFDGMVIQPRMVESAFTSLPERK